MACAGVSAGTARAWDARCVTDRLVTASRDNLVILTLAFEPFWYVTIRQ
jgi:hypothetical protein